jgi:hypothetical protein
MFLVEVEAALRRQLHGDNFTSQLDAASFTPPIGVIDAVTVSNLQTTNLLLR